MKEEVKISLSVPVEFRKKVKLKCVEEGVSIKELVIELLSKFLKDE